MTTNYFSANENNTTIDGYVSNASTKPIPVIFPVDRTIQMRTYPYHGRFYFKTREVASLLGIKQPFQFVADCKEFLGPGRIFKGERTEAFRSSDDSSTETFIEAASLLECLTDE